MIISKSGSLLDAYSRNNMENHKRQTSTVEYY